MVSRSLTEIFTLMRNNSLRNRHLSYEQENTERMSLVTLHDIEHGVTSDINLSPPWIDQLEAVQFTMSKLENKINELKALHIRNLHRPTLDDSSEEDVLIDRLTTDVSMMFNSAHRSLQNIKNNYFQRHPKEDDLRLNVIKSVVTKLQDLSMMFRNTQNSYLKQINTREERSKLYFSDPVLQNSYDNFNCEDQIDDFFVNKQVTQQQLLFLEEENTQNALQREQEVSHIVKSIVDLNDIFKDLAQMITDQGTVLDRIDYNIEQTQTQVYEGYKQLQKADMYQKKNRKMYCIVILATSIIVLIVLLIIFKY